MIKSLPLLSFILWLLSSSQSYAQTLTPQADESQQVQWLTAYGLSFGGADKVESLYNPYDDSFATSGLAPLGAGAALPLAQLPLSLEAMVSVHFDHAEAQQGDANLGYKTIDLLSFYRQGAHRFGLGFSHQLNPRFKTEHSYADEAMRFKDSTGTVAEYNYHYSQGTALGIRLTDIRYTPLQGDSQRRINGSNLSIFIKTFF
ncbi:hypothetical protein NO559_05095 [Dasania sp. GY-MA-18]|uniref:Outer membrane protein beta-barrel domain-containing protein n=1 Tax=Dasania phycosphaerae TaxID=2950436 RepID=A0A9J6RJH4_9GAMM|nr:MULTISPECIES: hypothetical protein [Dasania]MCR8922136.1 hypothetical protein [Dasania sp. GY-MA-18]MCZ0864564.1 hypothetical protein [Dasania phycosphaerae]MCZ0868292.1 hypothetical protein [Dasania phycosphaerae]